MLDFIFICKQKIIKYKKQLFTFVLIPVFMFRSSLYGFAAEYFYTTILPNDVSGLTINFSDSTTASDSNGWQGDIANMYRFSNASKTISSMNFVFGSSNTFNVISESYDYYVTLLFDGSGVSNTFTPNLFRISVWNGSSGQNVTLSDVSILKHSAREGGDYFTGFVCTGKLPDDWNGSLRGLYVSGSSGSVGSNLSVYISITQVSKNSSSVDVNGIISAINNQTIQQNNNFNNFMGSGSQFGGTSSDILSGNDTLSGFIDDYTEVEQSMYDKFTENQSAVVGNFSGFAWGSLSTAVDWTSDFLNRIYDNSGDFRTMFMYPILAGIALIFIGRQGLTAYVRSRREK